MLLNSLFSKCNCFFFQNQNKNVFNAFNVKHVYSIVSLEIFRVHIDLSVSDISHRQSIDMTVT